MTHLEKLEICDPHRALDAVGRRPTWATDLIHSRTLQLMDQAVQGAQMLVLRTILRSGGKSEREPAAHFVLFRSLSRSKRPGNCMLSTAKTTRDSLSAPFSFKERSDV
jgi:hypothetical protein